MTFSMESRLHRWTVREIRRITEHHPLYDDEANFLAYYARGSALSGQGLLEFRAVINWLHSTSRISPRERDELKKLTEEIAAWRPEEEHGMGQG